MIYTCTLNPSVDYKIQTKALNLGTLNRPKNTFFYPGGKGINVSRVLKNLGVKSTALGFLGGFTGQFIQDSLREESIATDFVIHDDPTRINVKIKTDKEETEVNGEGAFISQQVKYQLLSKIKKMSENDYLVLSGSLPPSISFDFYHEISATCVEEGVSLLLDIPNVSLKDMLQYRPFLIKPNQFEISEILGYEVSTKEAAVQGGKELVQLGAQNVMVSMGDKGAVFVNEQQVAMAETPSGTLKSSVGAGDSMVAGFLASHLKGNNVLRSFQYAVATGSATAFSDDLCKRFEVDQLVSKIIVEN